MLRLTGLSAVTHDASLTGDGTTGSPLGIANGGVSAGEAGKQMFSALTSASTKAVAGSGKLLDEGIQALEKTGKTAAGLINGLFGKKK